MTLLSENLARQRLNALVEQLASANGQHPRTVNTLLNQAIGVKTRKGISLPQLGAALIHVEQWLEDPSPMPTGRSAVPSANLDQLHGTELRSLLTTYVGPLAKALHTDIPLVQQRLNDWMDAPSRSEATDEQLRDGILQAAAWLEDPTSYRAFVDPQVVEPGGLPAPIHTKPAPADSTCSLCAAPVAAGETIGRMPRPRPPFRAMAWLCAHCLYDRRAKPRLTDVLLRVFHHVFSGSTTVPLNFAEARVMCEALSLVPTETEDEQLRETIAALHAGIEANAPAMLLSSRPALAAVNALRTATPGLDGNDAVTLAAVAEHLAQWERNPSGLDPEQFANRVEWRQAVLRCASAPTTLSERGGPFWV
ncbi:hypothetical protein [Streptomyces scabiei]|uniref:hypothetical protein n=1 Tax=Streptomyces scabiei TaxID=1930 RepID=UPI001B33DE22|nr:hypothetical protein [Streptomyces sp. LBUM 1487]MBP5888736.1 hypothetical protein [Streptomyces sp. LBUM 1487]